MEIDGATVVITGAAGAIGAATAHEMASRGANLVLSDLDTGRLDVVASEIGEAVIETVVGDVSDSAHHDALSRASKKSGGIDISILNAAIYLPGLVWELTEQQWRRQMEVNFWGVLHGVRTAVPEMIDRGSGHVVAVSSGAGLIATPGLGPYVASKHAVVGLMESLRHELNRVSPGVGASVVCPGNVRSDMATNSADAAGVEATSELSSLASALAEVARAGNAAGTGPEVVATAIADAVAENRFWVLPHPELGWAVEDRARRVNTGDEPVDLFG